MAVCAPVCAGQTVCVCASQDGLEGQGRLPWPLHTLELTHTYVRMRVCARTRVCLCMDVCVPKRVCS